jgi:carbon-monoxide dehydrogenase large subunit
MAVSEQKPQGIDAVGMGVAMPRLEDRRLTRGKGTYGSDLHFHNQAHLALLRSSYPHARIGHIDTQAARELPGVIAVFTGQDVVADGIGFLPTRVRRNAPNGEPNFVPPFPILAIDRVRHVGEAVVAVIAETLDIAKDALELIDVEYEPLPSVTDTGRAADDDAPELWPQAPKNICFIYEAGDKEAVERAFATAHHVTALDFNVSRVAATPMEPRNAIGLYDSAFNRYTLHSADQSPHVLRNELAELILKIPETDLRIVTPDCGGSFGMKYGAFPEQVLVRWAARKLGRPIRWVSDRSEAFMSDHHARDNVSRAELALDADGRFLAFRVATTANLGAYLDVHGIHTPTNNVGGLAGTYTTPHIAVRVTGIFSNTNPTSAYRGAGRPEASYAIERTIDIAAAELGIDRVELRRRNLISPDMMPFKTGLLYTYDSGEFGKNIDLTLDLCDWDGFERRREEALSRGKLRGIGLASVIEIAGGPLARPSEEFAEIRFDQSGNAHVMTGAVSQGQGHDTAFTQFVGQFLGLPPSRIRVSSGDTDQVNFGRGSFGSRTAAAVGASLRAVADKLIKRGKEIAAHLLETDADKVEFSEGLFRIPGSNRQVGIVEVAQAAFRADLLPGDFELGFSAHATVALAAPTFPNGCHVCEVEIDRDTGKLDLVGYWVVDDVGRIVNPMLVKGQMYGGIVQGLGQVTGEQIRYDGEGQLVTASFQDYYMPRAEHMPRMVVESNQVAATTNALGIKGAGEAGTVGALPAAMNAINHALLPLGIRHFEMPATPDRLWAAINWAPAANNAPE